MLYELMDLILFVALGAIAGIHISYGKQIESGKVVFSRKRHVITLLVAIFIIALAGIVARGLEEDSKGYLITLPLSIVAAVVAFRRSQRKWYS